MPRSRLDQAVAAAPAQPLGADAAALDHRATSNGRWARTAPRRRRSCHRRSTRRPARCSRAIAWRAEFGERVAFVDLGAARSSRSAAIGAAFSAARRVAQPAALRTGAPLSGRRRRRARSLRRAADARRAARRIRRSKSSSCSAMPPMSRRRGCADRKISRGRSRTRCSRDSRGAMERRARHACRCARRIARWTSCSTTGCCTRCWRAGCGRAPRTTRPAARTVSATSCRT